MATEKQPTPEEMQKLTAVSQAGAQAAADAPSPEQAETEAKRAMKEERDRQHLDMSDEDIDRIASAFVGKVVAEFEQRGAFDPPPEQVRPATPPPAPPAPGAETEAAAAAEAPVEAPPAPRKQTWAERFMGS